MNDDDFRFWQGRRVFVTGHTGFKGGWLSWWLKGLGARLTGYALSAGTSPSLYDVAQVTQAFDSEHVADVRDPDGLAAALHAAEPEVVFHLAAQPLVRASYASPLFTWGTNVMGTLHLLEAARHAPSVRAVVVVTTDKCYREQAHAHREDDPLGGHDPYSASKAGAELVTASHRDAYALPARGLGVASARAGNVIGGGDWSDDRLLPDLLRNLSRGAPVQLRRPQAVRPWQHVLEPLAGYLGLARRLVEDPAAHSQAFNFGPTADQALPVLDVAQRLRARVQAAGIKPGELQVTADAPEAALHEAPVLMLDSTRAHQVLGWQPRLDLDAALDLTWAWHHAWLRGETMRDATLTQIDDYLALEGATA